ncbi:AbrB family transcriptional regulator [Salisediminibacterium selenitireducens]|uniref:Membrane protein AbrB duplication n=1 Tax=Bacillus selenitireducens (strain ATCC 700615 / DSM 15326 / MLS10) TaxID=439292 RepID=D6XUH0_BACIE|nr:AbrB family transcriptional regulator [Salisediminibacterium selenitireducens]ADH99456.1 membrane protein AbrB duplication [[Bacillus] selenitireducens MLS10]
MSVSLVRSLLMTLATALTGAALFSLLSLPLPWMLGPLTAVMTLQAVIGQTLYWHPMIKNAGLIILGISFGLYFTIDTIVMTLPYFPIYIAMTFVLIAISVSLSYALTKLIPIDPASSIFGSIPGGLTEMVITSQSFHANQAFVTVFQTIRLVIVLFFVPFFIFIPV